MTAHDFLPIGIGAALVLNSYLHRRLVTAAQPLRLELADRGEKLLGEPALPPRVRAILGFVLDHAFSMRWLLVVSIIAIPVAVPVLFLRGELQRDAQETRTLRPDVRAEYEQVVALHGRIIFATHPLLTTITLLEMFLVAGPLVLLSGIVAGKLLPEINQTTLLQAIESEASNLGRRRAAA